jgi:hypothetical protein
VLTNHVAAITHIYTAPSVQLLTYAGQSALTTTTASLSSAHQAGIKERSSNQVSSSVTFSDIHDRISCSVSTLGPERPVFGVTAPGTAASAFRRSCPTYRATGRLHSPVAIPHTLGNWRICRRRRRRRHSSDRAPRPGNRRIRPTRLHNFSQFGNYTVTRQLSATAPLLPDEQRGCATSTTTILPEHAPLHLYRHIQHHLTGRNKRSFSGPHKLYGLDCQ